MSRRKQVRPIRVLEGNDECVGLKSNSEDISDVKILSEQPNPMNIINTSDDNKEDENILGTRMSDYIHMNKSDDDKAGEGELEDDVVLLSDIEDNHVRSFGIQNNSERMKTTTLLNGK